MKLRISISGHVSDLFPPTLMEYALKQAQLSGPSTNVKTWIHKRLLCDKLEIYHIHNVTKPDYLRGLQQAGSFSR